jgi:Holliday junction resolvase RusA-like endonuclease
MQILNIKPLSVNEVWQGKRFKTKKYSVYEKEMLLLLKPFTLPSSPLTISIEFGFSNVASDIDNPLKPFLDILQKKYLFNDKDIFELIVTKKKVNKNSEYIAFKIENYLTI